MKNKFIYLVLLTVGFVSCNPEFNHPISDAGTFSAGDADFSSYVAIGNSLTSGYMDGAISRVGQSYSFPNILAKHFAVVGGGAFTQPSYEDDVNNLGGLLLGGRVIYPTRLIINATLGGPQNLTGTPTIEVSKLQATAYNNMGIPGSKTFHLMSPNYGNIAGLMTEPPTANPYFVRQATSPTATVIGDAMIKNPTFFTNWIGNNDVLGYAKSGGTGSTEGMDSADITPINIFENSYKAIIDQLTSNGAKGVVLTIPDVTTIPFFTTIPYNPITAAKVASLNDPTGIDAIQMLNTSLYGPLKQALTAFGAGSRINLLSTTVANPLLIKDKTLPDLSAQLTAAFTPTLGAGVAALYGQIFGQARQTTKDDLVLLTTKTVIGTAPVGTSAPLDKYGITYPLEDQHILLPNEIVNAKNATAAFNNVIKSVATDKNLAVADMNAIMLQLVSGLRVSDGQIYTNDYFSTNIINTVLFSLDGVHPNARGYAVISNEIIKVINVYFNARIPQVDAGNYPGATVLATN